MLIDVLHQATPADTSRLFLKLVFLRNTACSSDLLIIWHFRITGRGCAVPCGRCNVYWLQCSFPLESKVLTNWLLILVKLTDSPEPPFRMFRFPDMHMPYKLVHKNKSNSHKFPDNAYVWSDPGWQDPTVYWHTTGHGIAHCICTARPVVCTPNH